MQKKESSIWNHGHDAGESGGLHEEWRPESEAYENRGWYASYEYSGNVVVWDEDSERYQFRDTYNTIVSGKGWMPKIHWNALVNLPSSDDLNPDYDYANDPASEAYLRAGIYYISGKSTVHVYGPVTVTSKPQTPQLSRSGVDASLAAAAKKENLRYTAKVWYDIRKLTWVPGKDARYDQGGHKGHWSDGAWQNNQDRATNPIPSWENYEEDVTICEMYHQVRAESVYGGIDVWWYKNIHRETLTISRVPSNDPNATPIVQNDVPFKRTEWIVNDRVLSNNYADYETN